MNFPHKCLSIAQFCFILNITTIMFLFNLEKILCLYTSKYNTHMEINIFSSLYSFISEHWLRNFFSGEGT